jgi:hypothetical protein
MDTKTKARVMRKLIRKFSEQQREEIDMDLAMDGSGECSRTIYDFHEKVFQQNLTVYLTILDLSRDDFEDYLRHVLEVESWYCKQSTPSAYYELQELQY